MTYEPKKIDKKAEKISLVMFGLAMVCTLLSNAVVEHMQWILQSVTILLLGIFIYILVKWSFTSYRYEIRAKSKMESCAFSDVPAERLQLTIHKSQSRRGYAADFICELKDIISIEPVSKESPNTGKKFVYYRNMDKNNRYVVTISGDNEPILLFLEIGEDGKEFIDFIKNKIA